LLHGEVYPDVPPAIRRWRASGRDVAIYSSGSELAQRRLFASTPAGDLTPLISGFFDTAVGSKREPASYWRIVSALNRRPSEVLFVSDLVPELDAARDAGLKTALCVRDGAANDARVQALAYGPESEGQGSVPESAGQAYSRAAAPDHPQITALDEIQWLSA
jgi:2,3-diketo-5-methylthio-1-phosphopentane phosphatase